MAFTNQFKSLAAVLKHYQIHYKEADFEIISRSQALAWECLPSSSA